MPPTFNELLFPSTNEENSAVALIRYSVNTTIQSSTKHTLSNLHTVRPHPSEKIGCFCERLQQYRDPVEGTKEEISDNTTIHHLLNFVGIRFSEATYVLRKQPNKRTALSRKDRMSSKPPGIRSVLVKKEVPWWQMVIIPNNPSFSGRI